MGLKQFEFKLEFFIQFVPDINDDDMLSMKVNKINERENDFN